MAEDEPDTVHSLLRNEIANNWIVETGLSIAEAREKWPLGIAVGKLNVVFAEGKELRLVLDSTVCQVNTRCHLPERLSLPMASDGHSRSVGASIDFKAAHKQAQVRPEEHGLLPFAFQEKLYRYRVCHFGGRFSALAHFCFARCMGCWLGSPTKPSSSWTTFCVHSSKIAHRLCLPWWCFSFAPLRRQFHGKRRSFRTALFGAAGRSTSPTTPFSSCPLN